MGSETFISRLNRFDPFELLRSRWLARRVALLLLLAAGFLNSAPAPLYAQSPSANYWQYPASGRLHHVLASDINHDSIMEFLVVDENGKIDLISSTGLLEWSYATQQPVLAIETVNIDGSGDPEREIVVGTGTRLILLSAAGEELWQTILTASPRTLTERENEDQEMDDSLPIEFGASLRSLSPFDREGDGLEEILVLLETGELQLYSHSGVLIWRHVDSSSPSSDAEPQMVVSDLDRDGQVEVAVGLFDPRRRFSQLSLISDDGIALWEPALSISGRITSVALVSFPGRSDLIVAVGNNLGQVTAYDSKRQRLWQRTLNKPITDMGAAHLSNGPGLVVATDVGGVIAFDESGRRVWSRYLAPNADRKIVAISTASFAPTRSEPSVSVVLASTLGEDEPADVVLLAANGRPLETISAADTTGLTRLIDINADDNSELLTARFAQVELIGLGLGVSEAAKSWDYNLLNQAGAVLVVDLDQDGSDELIIGTEDGRIHSLDSSSSIRWLHVPGGTITHLAAVVGAADDLPLIVAVRNEESPGTGEDTQPVAWLELRQANGRQLWELPFEGEISALEVGQLDGRGWQEIVIGLSDGSVLTFSASGDLLNQATITGGVEHLLIHEGVGDRPAELIAASANQLFRVSDTHSLHRIATYMHTITGILDAGHVGVENSRLLLVLVGDGSIRGTLTDPGIQDPQWVLNVGGVPTAALVSQHLSDDQINEGTSNSFLVSTDTGSLIQFSLENNIPAISWKMEGTEEATSVYWSDLDGDGLQELALGDENGIVSVHKVRSTGEPEAMAAIDLASSVLALAPVRRANDQKSDLLAVTENGLVQLFRAQENWPPLLTTPGVDVTQNQYSIVVAVQDVENDPVNVRLDLLDQSSDEWISQGEKRLAGGNGTLFWVVESLPVPGQGVTYRFHYDDGLHQGYLSPPMGPAAPPAGLMGSLTPGTIVLVGAVGLFLVLILLRQSQLPAPRARRFYRRLSQDRPSTLVLLESKYTHTDGSPDFLLHLANQARRQDDFLVADLADGLFLIADRPATGVSIVLRALQSASRLEPAWQELDRWQMTYKIVEAMLEAPTAMELSLIRPQLVQLLGMTDETEIWSPVLDALLPILTNLRDSERVELAEDRIVYLNEAAVLLERLREGLSEFSIRIERTLVANIVKRWSGLVSAEIEDLYGRAELLVELKTKRLAPVGRTAVVLEVRNSGRAAAENLMAEIEDDPSFTVHSSPEIIRLLPPGRARQIEFIIQPNVSDRFRLEATVTFDDRNRRDRRVSFGDMIHLLPPVRSFKPIGNPYLPGTPLRSNSVVFYGRRELFDFIADNAGDLSQRNVLIMVGERRTGKTSVLLRLDQHLPEHLLPVYIDCQSLGVIPGMPALLHDLAWYVADALANRGIGIDVPEPDQWQSDPTGRFEREFLPSVRAQISEGTTLLLVFDEFEAFENLVDDGILPATLFPYLRHLMQHSDGLSFVFVGTRRLEEMSADYWSVLFNIALYRKIGYLSDASATQLICEPVRPNLIYDDLALDKILRVTTGHPYFLQLVCYTLVKRANARRTAYATVSDVNAAIDEMLSLGEVHFAYLWQRSSYTERALLMAMAHLMDRDTPFHAADLIQFLKPYEIFITPAQVMTGLNRLVERDILREVTEGATSQYELRIGLVGLWIARYKSLSMLVTGNGEARSGDLQRA
jgi:hypothetical protein